MRTALLVTLLLPVPGVAQVNNGPDAPDVVVGYQAGTGFTFSLSNPLGSNNEGEMYQETIFPVESSPDPVWRFQGYVVYQFAPGVVPSPLAVLDPDQARPVVIADKADDVSTATMNLDPAGPGDCVPMTWMMLNTGIPEPIIAPIDPFTLVAHLPDVEYCFLALAFAHNPYHLDPTCNTSQQILQSLTGAFGSVIAHCAIGNNVGIAEQGRASITISSVPGNDQLRIQGDPTDRYALRVYSSLGALVHESAFTGGDLLDVAGWPAGIYSVRITDREGRVLVRPMLVGQG